MRSPTANQFSTSQFQTYSSNVSPVAPVAYTAGHTETFTTTHQTATATGGAVQTIGYQPHNAMNYQITGPAGSSVNTRFTGNTTGGFPPIKNVTSIQTLHTAPIIAPPKEYYEPIETYRAMTTNNFPPYPIRPSTPPNAGFGFGRGGGMCASCCPCFGTTPRPGLEMGMGMNPGMNMGMGMRTGGCCSGLCGNGMGGGMCGGGSGGGLCCPGGGMGMGMGGGTGMGCCGPICCCCPFGGGPRNQMEMATMGMGGMPIAGGISTPTIGGGLSTPAIGSATGFGVTTPGIGMTPGFGAGGGMGYNAGVYGPGLGTTGCCFCPQCTNSNGCCACLGSPDCCCMY